MNLNKMPKVVAKSKKRVGRGYGSGKGGHTVGRGAKGAKARGKIGLTFEGTKIKKSLLKRLPLQRGKGKLKSRKASPVVINIEYLNLLPKNATVDVATLVKFGLVKEKEAKEFGVKILGGGELKIPLKVALPCSRSALKKIEKVSGKQAKK